MLVVESCVGGVRVSIDELLEEVLVELHSRLAEDSWFELQSADGAGAERGGRLTKRRGWGGTTRIYSYFKFFADVSTHSQGGKQCDGIFM